MIAGVCSANQFGFEVEKDVNGGYEVSMPVVIDMQSQLPFLPKAYFKGSPIFTAPRGDFFQQINNLNHSRFDAVIGGGITLLGGNLELETGLTHWWAGNSQGIPEGTEWDNTFRYYWVW